MACGAEGPFGAWKMNSTRSTWAGEANPKSLTLRIEPHAQGEVFTLDRIYADGRATSASTILYLDGRPHDFEDFGCSGTQSSRRVDSRTVEILQTCAGGAATRFVRRVSAESKELILEVTDHQRDGRRVERRLVLEKQ